MSEPQYEPKRTQSKTVSCVECKQICDIRGFKFHLRAHQLGAALRKKALALGQKYYFTGIACTRGHTDRRRASNGECLTCERTNGRDSARRRKEICAERARGWYANNKERAKAKSRRYAKEHPDRVKVIEKRTRAKNKGKALERGRRYKRENPEKIAAANANRRAAKRQAMPQWVNKADILTIYANRPDGYQVDHIVPLKSPVVCGLHVPWNLQYLTAEENNRKHNRLIADVAYAARSAVEMNR